MSKPKPVLGRPRYADGTPYGAGDVAVLDGIPGRVLFATICDGSWHLTIERPAAAAVTVPADTVHPPS